MKKVFLFFVVILLFIVPGCRDKLNKTGKKSSRKVLIPREKKKAKNKTGRSLFLEGEDIKEFVFEEENEGNMLSHDLTHQKATVKLVESDSEDTDFASRQIEQLKYGFKRVYFDFDRYAIRKDQKDALSINLKAVKRALTEGKDIAIVVEGHACRFAGSDVYNIVLSEERAQSVAKWLVGQGVPVERLKIVGRGNEMPLVPHGDKIAQAPNRRVELYTIQETEV